MKLDAVEDRKEINKIIENCLPLMENNKRFTQECADAIIVYFIDKEECRIQDKEELHKCGQRKMEGIPCLCLKCQEPDKCECGHTKKKHILSHKNIVFKKGCLVNGCACKDFTIPDKNQPKSCGVFLGNTDLHCGDELPNGTFASCDKCEEHLKSESDSKPKGI